VGISLVAGGAGFLGSHLCDALLASGHEVVALDNFITGSRENLAHLGDHPRFTLIERDVTEPLDLQADAVFHLASPASPQDFATLPEAIMWVNVLGTRNLCDVAQANRAPFLFASTSEIYGEPLVHPQVETYHGNVNPIGPRACYDESKRFGEALVMSRRRTHGLNARIVRIFNTFGPRMRLGDGRMSIEFIRRALGGQPLPIWGDGSKTRSLCYVSDLVAGIARAMFQPNTDGGVFNLGSPEEHSVAYYAKLIIELTGSPSTIEYNPARPDDPSQRRPDITRARTVLDWSPQISQREGLAKTIAWYRERHAFAATS